MNRKEAYAEALAIVNGKLGHVSTLQPKDMTTDQAIGIFYFLRQANFLDLVGHEKTADGVYPANGWNKDQQKVYSQLVRIMWQAQAWGNQKHVTPFDFAPTGRRFTYQETLKNGIHKDQIAFSNLTLVEGQTFNEFDYYKGSN